MTLSSIAALQQALEALEKANGALRSILFGAVRSSNGRMGAWATPGMATMEQCDDAQKSVFAALSSLRAVVKDPGEGEVRMLTDDEIADCECAREVQTGREVIRKFCEVNRLRLSTSTRTQHEQ